MQSDDPPPEEPTTDPGPLDSTLVPPSAPRPGEAPGGPERVTREAPGRYRIDGTIGGGGQATVYAAWDSHLEREVAVKVPRLDGDHAAHQRFLREARIAARLEHPNIVPIYEIGQRADGTIYTTQKLVRGEAGVGAPLTFRTALREAGTLEKRLALLPNFLGICQGTAYAHSQGVVHRDLKPENVVLGNFGETLILDWGLARAKEDAPGSAPALPRSTSSTANLTVVGQVHGTPAYMSPEQARGAAGIDVRSDVWSLGVMLCELLSGRLPFVGGSSEETLRLVREAPLPSLALLARGAPPELIAIATRALQREPERRYPSAAALAEDVSAYLRGRRVGVYAYGPLELLKLLVSRNKVAAAIGGVAAVLLLAVAGVALQKYAQARVALAQALLERGREAESALRWDRAAVLYAGARAQDDTPETQWAMRLAGARPVVRVDSLAGISGPVRALVHSPDGQELLAGGGNGLLHVVGAPALAHKASVQTGPRAVTGVALSPDATWVATTSDDGVVKLFAREGLREVAVLAHASHAANGLRFSHDGALLAAAFEDGAVRVFDVGSRALVFESQPDGGPIYAVSFSRSGALAWVGWTGWLFVREATGGVRSVRAHSQAALDVKFDPAGEQLATAGREGAVHLWRATDLELVHTFEGHTQKVYAVAFSPDGKLLASGGSDRSVRLWDVPNRQSLVGQSFNDGEDVVALSWSPAGDHLVWAGSSGALRTRAITAQAGFGSFEKNIRLYALAASPDGRFLFSAGGPGSVIRDAATHQILSVVEGDGVSVEEARFSADSRVLAWVSRRGRLCVAPPLRPTEPQCFEFNERINAIALAPDASWVAAGGKEGLIRLWSTATSAQLAEFRTHDRGVYSLAASPDGRTLASGSYDNTIALFDVPSRREVQVLRGHTHGVRRVAFSPDGKTLASASWDKTVRLWDLPSGRQRAVGDGHADHVFGLSWDPRGRWLATGGWDGTIRIWDAVSAKELGRVVADVDRVFSLAVNARGDGLWYAGFDVHRLDFRQIGTPAADLAEEQRRWGLALEGVTLTRAPASP